MSRDKITWTVAARRVAWLSWRWTVSAPVPPLPASAWGKMPPARTVVAYGSTFTRRGAERAAKRWVRTEVLNRDSRYTMDFEA